MGYQLTHGLITITYGITNHGLIWNEVEESVAVLFTTSAEKPVVIRRVDMKTADNLQSDWATAAMVVDAANSRRCNRK